MPFSEIQVSFFFNCHYFYFSDKIPIFLILVFEISTNDQDEICIAEFADSIAVNPINVT